MRFRVNAGGNYCGHHPENPRIGLMEPVRKGKGGLPGVLTTLMERVVRYYDSPWTIPSLNLANQSTRQQRSERREACLSALWAILKYTDLASLRVGVPTPDGGFVSLTVRYLAKQTGLEQRRMERAIGDLKAAGLVGIHPRCKQRPDGSYQGKAAIKTVPSLLFALFGLGQRLKFERARAAKRLKKKQRQQQQAPGNRTARARRSLTARAALDSAGSALKGLGSKARGRKAPPNGVPSGDEIEQRRQAQLLAVEYKQANPTWTATECREAAEKAIEARWR